jgi:hypothetical protein
MNGFLIIALLIQTTIPYRIVTARNGLGSGSQGNDYSISVNLYLDVSGARNIVCALIGERNRYP